MEKENKQKLKTQNEEKEEEQNNKNKKEEIKKKKKEGKIKVKEKKEEKKKEKMQLLQKNNEEGKKKKKNVNKSNNNILQKKNKSKFKHSNNICIHKLMLNGYSSFVGKYISILFLIKIIFIIFNLISFDLNFSSDVANFYSFIHSFSTYIFFFFSFLPFSSYDKNNENILCNNNIYSSSFLYFSFIYNNNSNNIYNINNNKEILNDKENVKNICFLPLQKNIKEIAKKDSKKYFEKKEKKSIKKEKKKNMFIICADAQLKILSPRNLVNKFKKVYNLNDAYIPGTTATFGAPAYGQVILGKIIYVYSPSNFCNIDFLNTNNIYNNNNNSIYNNSNNTYINNNTNIPFLPLPSSSFFIEEEKEKKEKLLKENIPGLTDSNSSIKNIFLIKRGGCTFVQKVKNAEKVNADAVVIIDEESSSWTRDDIRHVIMADNGRGTDVYIPSILICKEDGALLLDSVRQYNEYYLNKQKNIINNNNNNNSSIYNNNNSNSINNNNNNNNNSMEVFVELEWNLPQQHVVDVDFWTDSANTEGVNFLTQFAPIANLLQGRLRFALHFFIFDLPADLDDLCYDKQREFCADAPKTDPHSDIRITGKDVVEEDLRQLCIYKLTGKKVDGLSDSYWSEDLWKYIDKWAKECKINNEENNKNNKNKNNSLYTFGRVCAERVISEIKSLNLKKINECMSSNEATKILREEKENRAWSVLALRINDVRFSGRLDIYQVLKAICSAFLSQPPECSQKLAELEAGLGALNGNIKVSTSEYTSFSSLNITTFFLLFFLVVLMSVCFIAIYQYKIKKSIRREMHNEIMLEVKTQMQEYHQMPNDESIPETHTENRPLMVF